MQSNSYAQTLMQTTGLFTEITGRFYVLIADDNVDYAYSLADLVTL